MKEISRKILNSKRLGALILGIFLILPSLTGCTAANDKQFNSVLAMADKSFAGDDFTNAKVKYTEALKYKEDTGVKEKVEKCDILTQSLNDFNKGNDYFSKKDYLNAYRLFKKVQQDDEKRYETAQQKLQESKALYIQDKTVFASEAVSKSNYNEAINYITEGLKIDSEEQELLQLKEKYQVALDKQIEEQKRIEEERKKKEAEAKAAAEAKAKQEAEAKAAETKRLEEQKSVTVYVTKTGEKYHTDGCRYLSKSKIAISLSNAKRSYSPCSVCNPPR